MTQLPLHTNPPSGGAFSGPRWVPVDLVELDLHPPPHPSAEHRHRPISSAALALVWHQLRSCSLFTRLQVA